MIKLKKPLSLALITIFISSILNVANATTDNTVIELSHTYTPYVNFTGTAPGASRFYDNDDLVNFIFPLTVVLGTMGLESNVGGNCDLEFSTLNDFELKHTIIPTSGGEFTINYQGQTFTKGNNPIISTPCTTSATDLSFELNNLTIIGFDNFIPSGLFKDIVTVVVTTQ